jgi:hypothetical protein
VDGENVRVENRLDFDGNGRKIGSRRVNNFDGGMMTH